MNGVCGIISYNQTETRPSISKMEKFICADSMRIEISDMITLSVHNGDYSEHICNSIHILCVVIGKSKSNTATAEKLSKSVAMLYIKHGRSFTGFISENFSVIIYDFIKKEFMFFENGSSGVPLFYTLSDQTLYFSTNIHSLFEIPENKKVFTSLSINKLFTLSPALKSGETVYDNIFFLPPGHHIIFNKYEFNVRENLYPDGNFSNCVLEDYTIADKCNPYHICDIKLSPSFALNPFVLQSALNCRKFTNKMLIDLLFANNLSFSFETPFPVCIDSHSLFSVTKDEIKENIILPDYRTCCLCEEISEMEYFNYTDEKDIERCEIIFLNKKMLIPQLICDIFSFVTFFNIKNESFLDSPQTLDYILKKSRHKNVNEILSEIFMTDIYIEKSSISTNKFCLELKNICNIADLKLFNIFDRFKLFEKAEKLNPELALYILQINYLLEQKDINLEF